MKKLLSSIAIAVAFSAAIFSSPVKAASADASKYVESLGNHAVTIISDKKLSKPQKQEKLERIFADNVDIDWVGKFVMGRFWKQATPEQQKRYLKEYQKFIIAHYAARFAEYSGGKFNITGTRDDGDNEYMVSMEMLSADPKAEPVLVDYRVRDGSGYKVFDVIVEGVSMITTQRSEFNSILTNKGIDYLIEKLATKSLNADLPAAK